MRLVVFGLTISSSWGNGHATLWRGLARALSRRGHSLAFFEKDVPYYAEHRDGRSLEGCTLFLYGDWEQASALARLELERADAAVVSSYCPDGRAAARLVLSSPARCRAFYDLDTPVTLARLRAGESVDYLPEGGLGDFDLVLSYSGGPSLSELRRVLHAERVAPLYGCVDPEVHHPAPPEPEFQADLSYMGTWAAERDEAVQRLFVGAAERLPERRFLIGGALYPRSFPWRDNIWYTQHVPPARHAAFFSSGGLTLSIARKAMAENGWCPSGRLFEAAACGAAMISDAWAGLEHFFEPGEELLVARSTDDVVAALELPAEVRMRLARAARQRVLREHTAERRADQLIELLREAGA